MEELKQDKGKNNMRTVYIDTHRIAGKYLSTFNTYASRHYTYSLLLIINCLFIFNCVRLPFVCAWLPSLWITRLVNVMVLIGVCTRLNAYTRAIVSATTYPQTGDSKNLALI